jgi:hypothetical protein
MAIIVPRAKSDTSSTLEALPSARMTAEAPSGAFNRGAAEVNQALQGLFADEKKKADMSAFLEADYKASKVQAEMDAGYKKNFVGKNSVGAAPAAEAEYEKQLAEISKGLTPNQRDMFESSAKQRRATLYSSLEHHSSLETMKYRNAVDEVYLSDTVNTAVTSAKLYKPGDAMGTSLADDGIRTALLRQEAVLAKRADEDHMGPEWLASKRDELRSRTHKAVIDVMLSNGNDLMAKDYLTIYGSEITNVADVSGVDKAMREGSIRGESTRQHDKLVAGYDTWEARDKAASEIADPEVRARTKQLLDDSFGREKRFVSERRDNNFIGAAAEAEKAGTTAAISPSIWAEMTPAERTAIETRLKNVKEGTEPSTDFKVWTNFQFLPTREIARITPAQMLRDYRPYLDDTHYDAALRQIGAAQEALSKGPSGLSAMQSDSDVVKNAYMRYSGKGEAKDFNDDNRREFIEFSDKASVAVQKYEIEKGGKATDEEKQKIVNGILVNKVYVEGWGRDEKVAATLVKQDDQDRVYVPMSEIPELGRRGLVNWARSKGVIPQNATQAEAEKFLGPRLERAFGLGTIGASDDSIEAILLEGPRMQPARGNAAAGLIKRN